MEKHITPTRYNTKSQNTAFKLPTQDACDPRCPKGTLPGERVSAGP